VLVGVRESLLTPIWSSDGGSMLTSPRLGISYPNPDNTDHPTVPAFIGNLIPNLDAGTIYASGTDSARIARAHFAGTYFWTTDKNTLWYDDGTNWQQVSAASNLAGTTASRPSASAVPSGTVYKVTDDLLGIIYRSDGTNWKIWSAPARSVLDNVTVTTSTISVTATTAGTANTLITSSSLTLEGSTNYLIEYFAPAVGATGATSMTLVFYEDSTSFFNLCSFSVSTTEVIPVYVNTVWSTSTSAHTFSIKAFVGSGTGQVFSGAGTSGNLCPSRLTVSRW
jgi:hypothetical protein